MIRQPRQINLFEELVIDNFAGGGGASTGIEKALGRPIDIAINHDPEAIAMHKQNHPFTKHYCENVFNVNPREATGGKPIALVWLSPDCKHFSKAKGGKPRDKNIRALATVAIDWARETKPRVIMLENVEEFQTWGPLDDDGFPIKERAGEDFHKFISDLQSLGYVLEKKELKACDFGAPTTRKRLFIIARCDGQPIVWPEPTHGSPTSKAVLEGKRKPWRTAAECIDWSIPCPSIFERERPLAEKTLKRIARGIIKYVLHAKEPFIVTLNHSGEEFRGNGLSEQFKTLTASRDDHRLVVPSLIQNGYGERQGQEPRTLDIEKPLGTVMGQGIKHTLVAGHLTKFYGTATGHSMDEPVATITSDGQHHGVVGASLIQMGFGEKKGCKPRCIDPTKPLGTVMAGTIKHALAVAMLIKNYGGHGAGAGIAMGEPLHTVTAKDHHSLVTAKIQPKDTLEDQLAQSIKALGGKAWNDDLAAAHLARDFGESTGCTLDEPAPTVMPGGNGKTQIVVSHLTRFRGDNQVSNISEPVPTVVSSGINIGECRAFLSKYYGDESTVGSSLEEPVHTIRSKDCMALIVTYNDEDYVLADIGMRMLDPAELYKAQGFPDDYETFPEVNGKPMTKTARIRMVGNSVSPPVAEALVRANLGDLASCAKLPTNQKRNRA